ncbi:hypothetical protein [Spiroplasma culicicola]|uniref:Uncharacterized protein n=1 Tax=Spiroplasma culicicola AES-1 TaxID=1276246 RepID=W6AGQ6_9MOLU|nr:hypothetical protein [Spiroplasma culicicola]AHI52869.1 hypothetical protein SCULI_v1c05280 [Spiroplasma culicicola AES-1]
MAAKSTSTKSTNLNNLKPKGDANKMTSGKKLERPTILPDKNNKVNLLTQSKQMLSAKKGKGDISALPQGVQDSVKNKERIESILNYGAGQNTVDEIRKKYDIQSKPITLKTARIITEERNQFFEENRKKAGKAKSLPLIGEKKAKAPAAKKTATAKKATKK